MGHWRAHLSPTRRYMCPAVDILIEPGDRSHVVQSCTGSSGSCEFVWCEPCKRLLMTFLTTLMSVPSTLLISTLQQQRRKYKYSQGEFPACQTDRAAEPREKSCVIALLPKKKRLKHNFLKQRIGAFLKIFISHISTKMVSEKPSESPSNTIS